MRKKKRNDLREAAIRAFFFTCGVLAVLVLVGIFLTLVTTSFPAFREIKLSEFILKSNWDPGTRSLSGECRLSFCDCQAKCGHTS